MKNRKKEGCKGERKQRKGTKMEGEKEGYKK